MTLDFARSIGDDYPDYVDDELGYRYHASEVISAAESRRLQRIRILDSDRVTDLEDQLDEYTDLERWALARRHLRDDRRHNYLQHVQAIVDGPLDHPALDYPEIFVDLARQRARNGDLEAARQLVDRMQTHWPQLDEALPLLHAQTRLWAGDVDEADRAFDEALEPFEDDVDLRIETAEDFLEAGALDYARQWIDRARRVAESIGDSASIVDIELLERRLADDAESGDEQRVDNPTDGDEFAEPDADSTGE